MPSSYKIVQSSDGSGRTTTRHKDIMEQYLGRRLEPDEVAHHCNENKRDDRIENLELMLRGPHARLHLYKSKIVNCGVCDAELVRRPSQIRSNRSGFFFCDNKCRNSGMYLCQL